MHKSIYHVYRLDFVSPKKICSNFVGVLITLRKYSQVYFVLPSYIQKSAQVSYTAFVSIYSPPQLRKPPSQHIREDVWFCKDSDDILFWSSV